MTETLGIPCPVCSSATSFRVTDSRPSRNSIRRRRACTCGFTFTTYEYSAADIQDVLEAIKKIKATTL